MWWYFRYLYVIKIYFNSTVVREHILHHVSPFKVTDSFLLSSIWSILVKILVHLKGWFILPLFRTVFCKYQLTMVDSVVQVSRALMIFYSVNYWSLPIIRSHCKFLVLVFWNSINRWLQILICYCLLFINYVFPTQLEQKTKDDNQKYLLTFFS